MGYPTVKNFDISYIKRTLENLNKFDGENNFTMLFNSLLGLLILPNEYNIKKARTYSFDFFKQKITSYSVLKDIFLIKDITLVNEDNEEYKQRKFFWLSNSNMELQPKNIKLGELIRRIRNGVAHFGIIPTKEGDIWKGVIIRNYPDDDSEHFNLEIYFEESELKAFAELIANKYLETINK